MPDNNRKNIKDRLKKGDTIFGTWNIIASPSLVEAIGYSGLDFVVIDAEHGPVNMETAENLIRAAEVTGMAPIIRVPHNEPHLILRALDIGAHGVQVPHISTRKEAESAVESSKYHPVGKRGLSPFTRAGKYGTEMEGHTTRSNENTMVIVNIEGTAGVKNLIEITDVPGIDVIFIGPYDLSQSLGMPGQVTASEVIDLINSSAKIAKEKGLVCGSFAKDLGYLEILIECGIRYITYMVDTSVVSQSYGLMKKTFNELVSNRRKLK